MWKESRKAEGLALPADRKLQAWLWHSAGLPDFGFVLMRNGLKVLQFGSPLCNLSNWGDLQVH